MRSTPILFSEAMVQAILRNHKTVTRRICGDRIRQFHPGDPVYYTQKRGAKGYESGLCPWNNPYGNAGDLLWVKETWAASRAFDKTRPSRIKNTERVWYRAGLSTKGCGSSDDVRGRWRPSIFMPMWASRIRLQIKSVTIERVQDISEDDAKAEGVEPYGPDDGRYRHGFAELWDSINESRGFGWDTNPWVWVIQFTRC